ncbi:hypothetical protein GOBAR_DD15057 [Gossypium barbadense]|nr:hypothetical protein GOBAR_DD15057 [Gossypium barbadense]
MNAVHRHRCHILHPARSIAQSANIGCEGVIDSVREGRNARNIPGVGAIRVVAMNSVATARPEGSAQGRHAGKDNIS